MSAAQFVIEVKRRLLMDTHASDEFCPQCDQISDCRGRHDVMCSCAGDRVRRHNAARNYGARVASRAGLNPEVEKPNLLQPSPEHPDQADRRPADVFLPTWLSGAPVVLDFAVVSPQRQDALRQSSLQAGFAAMS